MYLVQWRIRYGTNVEESRQGTGFRYEKIAGNTSASSLYSTSWKKERVKSISILEWKKKNLEIQRDSVRETVKKIEPNRKEGVWVSARIELKIYFVGKDGTREIRALPWGRHAPTSNRAKWRVHRYALTRPKSFIVQLPICSPQENCFAARPSDPSCLSAFLLFSSPPLPRCPFSFRFSYEKKKRKHFCFVSDSSLFNIATFLCLCRLCV